MPHLKLLFWCASLFSPYFSLSVENPNKMSGVVPNASAIGHIYSGRNNFLPRSMALKSFG